MYSPTGARPEARQLLEEALSVLPHHAATASPAWQAILAGPPPLHIATIHAALEIVGDRRPPAPGASEAALDIRAQRSNAASQILGLLFQRKPPLAPGDVAALVAALDQSDPTLYVMEAIPEIVQGLSVAAAPEAWTDGQRAVFRRLLHRLPYATLFGGQRPMLTRLLEGMLARPDGEAAPPAAPPETPQMETNSAPLQQEALELLVAFERDVDAAGSDNRRVFQGYAREPQALPTGRAVLGADASLQLAVWEAALTRYLGVGTPVGPKDQAYYALLQAYDKLLMRLPTRSLARVRADVAALLDRLLLAAPLWTTNGVGYVQQPLLGLVERIEADGLVPFVRTQLGAMRERLAEHTYAPRTRDFLVVLDQVLAEEPLSPIEAVDDWGSAAVAAWKALDEPQRSAWTPLLAYARSVPDGAPSARWLDRARPLIAAIGPDSHVELTIAWLELLKAASPVRLVMLPPGYAGTPSAIPSPANATLLRGLVWLSALNAPARMAPHLTAAALRCFAKIPGAGSRAVAVGNACLAVLGKAPALERVGALQAIRHHVTFLPALKRIDAMLEAAAREAGMSKEDLEDLTVPTFGLLDGRRREALGTYVAELAVFAGNVELRWSKDGAPLKGEPVAAKRSFPEEAKALHAAAGELRRQLPIQRERLERALMTARTWPLPAWRERVFDHPLLATLARRLIWQFDGPSSPVAAWDGGRLVTVDDRPCEPSAQIRVSLWHPINADPAAGPAWRAWLERHAVTQPFKQAHREVYLLTEAERRTGSYSNRFAGHILRQHQMHALAQTRGWKAPLAMLYDGGENVELSLALPTFGLEAAYFVDGALAGDAWEDSANANGVHHYVTTDQVRFRRTGEVEPIALDGVPTLAFSEVMRDVDLFVGVTSVGADPTWQDRGNAPQHAYWHRFAFGELSESARTRREALERLLPRLVKLRQRWELTERFLVVHGDLRTYKIHLGSGNILMEPNDQYLCIVPDRRQPANAGNLFLPFGGDNILSVILSKALLLAEDANITDPTITGQIRR